MSAIKQGSTRLSARLMGAIVAVVMLLGLLPLEIFAQPSPEAENGLYTSVGESTTGYTYYVDAENGDDTNTGRSPDKAWQSLDKVSETTFLPGDHILLRASSTWNDQMLFPKGDGSLGSPIVIDLYDMDGDTAVYSTDTRPVINGNGTEGIGSKKTVISGAVMLYNQEYWEIRNLEVTNSEDLSDPDAYRKHGTTQRAGILVYGDTQDHTFNHLYIIDCYVHDVQSENHNWPRDSSVGGLKAAGGIIVLGHHLDPDGNYVTAGGASGNAKSTTGYDDVLIEGNVVKRVGLEGIRTKINSDTSKSGNTFNKTMYNVTIRNNYLEDIVGDGIVLTEVADNGLVENNIAKAPNNTDLGTLNYAGIWSMYADNLTFQYNEVYGIVYGYNDGEAYDIDMACYDNVYQYNYSHHNKGGFFLFMGNQYNSVVRYNISANDGGGNAGVGEYRPSGTSTYTYKEQSIFHYWNKTDNNTMPTIYNNTFYVGDGVSTALFGEGNSSNNSGTIVRFYNNILYKEGEGQVRFLTNQPTNGADPTERKMVDNPQDFIKNNIFYTDGNPAAIATETSGATQDKLESAGNLFVNPQLVITEESLQDALEAQNDTAFDMTTSVYDFTSTDKLRERASMFKVKDTSPAAGAGTVVSNQYISFYPTEDFFGNSIVDKIPDIGAHQVSDIDYKTEVKELEAVSVSTIAGIYPSLPRQITVTFEDIVGEDRTERSESRSVVWDTLAYEDYTQAGTVTVEGTVEGIEEKATATVTVTGSTGAGDFSQSFASVQDAYVQRDNASGGSTAYGSQPGTTSEPSSSELYKHPYGIALTNNYVLKIKNASANTYNRRFIIQFDISDFDGDWSSVKNAAVQLYIARYDAWTGAGSTNQERLANTAYMLDVYAIDENTFYDVPEFDSDTWDPTWDESTVTWDNAPLNQLVSLYNSPNSSTSTDGDVPTYDDIQPVAHNEIINKDVIANNDRIDIDVSDYIRQLDNDVDTVSFLVVIPKSTLSGYNKDNSGFDAFSKEGAAAAYQFNIDNSLGLDIESPTALAPQLVISDIYETGVDAIEVETKLGQAPSLPDTATLNYSDGSVRTLGVTWNAYDAALLNEVGSFQITGYSTATSYPIIANVTVKADYIVGFEPLPDIDAANNLPRNQLGLPVTATAIVQDSNETIELDIVAWNDSAPPFSPNNAPNEYDFTGIVHAPTGYVILDDAVPSQKVITHPVPVAISFDAESKTVDLGSSVGFTVSVDCGDYPADDWSSRVLWSIEGADNTIAVDQNGTVTVTEDATPATYMLTVTSMVDASVTASADVVVKEPGAPADKTELSALLATARPLAEADYTSGSWSAFALARDNAEAVLADSSATQEAVNNAWSTLKNAMDALVNIADLKELYSTHKDWVQGAYTDGSWADFETALANAAGVLADADASTAEVAAAKDALEAAIVALDEDPGKEVDKAALQALYDEYSDVDETLYTTGSWAALVIALEATEPVLANTAATQAEVNQAHASLQAVVDALELRGDKTALAALVAEVDGKNEADYTASSWATMNIILSDARDLLAEVDAMQEELTAMETDLREAVEALVDISGLREAIADAKALSESSYTPSSWQKLKTAIEAAEATLGKADASKATVAVATANLETAVAGLVKRADTSSLASLVGNALALDESRYTAASWAPFAEALLAASTVIANPEATQQQVNDTHIALRDSMAALVKNPAKLLSDSKIKVTGKEGVEIKLDADLEDFGTIRVAGKELQLGVDYTVREGSVIINLLPAYVQGLANGTYSVEVVFAQGSVTLTLEVARSTTDTSDGSTTGTGSGVPSTGDAGMSIPVSLLFAALLSMCGISILKRKKMFD